MKHKLKTTVLVTSIAVTVLHMINHCVNKAATVRGLLSKNSGHYYSWRFGDIYYTKHGTGSPLLLLHDLTPYSSSYEWNELIKKLSSNHTVYAFDFLGCGRSDKPNLTYTNFLYVQLISDFIKNVIGEKTDVAVSGLASSCVLMACHSDDELFNNIMLINPESISKLSRVPGRNGKIIKFLMDLPIIGTAVYNMITRKENIEYLFTEKYLFNPFHFSQKELDIFHESAHLGESGGKYLLSSINGLYLNINIKKALSEINNSIFIAAGKHCDNIQSIMSEYAEINPAIEIDYIEDSKMLPHMENPSDIYRTMKIFF